MSTRFGKTTFVLAGGVFAGAINSALLAHRASIAMIDKMAAPRSRVTTREIFGFSWKSLLAVLGLGELEMHIVPPLIARARESTRAWVRSGGLARTEFPPPLNVHSH